MRLSSNIAQEASRQYTAGDMVVLILCAIQRCCEAGDPSQDRALATAISELRRLKELVRSRWPLPKALKSGIILGPLASKNFEDWEPSLADILTELDYLLRHDGVEASGDTISGKIFKASVHKKVMDITTKGTDCPKCSKPTRIVKRVRDRERDVLGGVYICCTGCDFFGKL